MPQDSPATDAGTEATPPRTTRDAKDVETDRGTPDTWAPVNRRTMRDDVDRFRNQRMPVPKDTADALRLLELALEYYEHAAEVVTRTSSAFAELDAETDELRDRCMRAIMHERDPGEDQNNPEFFKFTGGRYSKSQTGAEKLVDLAPAMVTHLEERRRLAAKKGEAEKEIGVARRRHATAITYANAFIFSLTRIEMHGIGDTDAAVRADVTAGDTDRGSLAEAP